MFTLLKSTWQEWRRRREIRGDQIDWSLSIEAIQEHIITLASKEYNEEEWIEISGSDGISTSSYVEVPEEHIILGRALRQKKISEEELAEDENTFLEGRPLSMALMNTLVRAGCVDWTTVFNLDKGHFFLGMYRIFSIDEIPNNPLLNYYFDTHHDITSLLQKSGDVDVFTFLKIGKNRGCTFDTNLCKERELFYRNEHIPYGFHGGILQNLEDFVQALQNLQPFLHNHIKSLYYAPSLFNHEDGLAHPHFQALLTDKIKDIHNTLIREPAWLQEAYESIHAVIEVIMLSLRNLSYSHQKVFLQPLQYCMTGKHYDMLRVYAPTLCQELLGEQYAAFCELADIYGQDDQRPFLGESLPIRQETTLHW